MKPAALSDKQRNRIIRHIRPEKDDYFSYQNLNLLTGVEDEETGKVLTCVYYLSTSISRMPGSNDEYHYILLGKLGAYVFPCSKIPGHEMKVKSPFPAIISDEKLEEMVRYYENSYSERRELGEKVAEKAGVSRYAFTSWYLETYFWKH